MPDEKTMLTADCWLHVLVIVRQLNTYSRKSKLLTPNMYCWSYKTLVSIHCIDFSV